MIHVQPVPTITMNSSSMFLIMSPPVALGNANTVMLHAVSVMLTMNPTTDIAVTLNV